MAFFSYLKDSLKRASGAVVPIALGEMSVGLKLSENPATAFGCGMVGCLSVQQFPSTYLNLVHDLALWVLQ